MQLRCVNCDKTLEIPDSASGKKVRCPACMTTMLAPQTNPGAAPTSPPATGFTSATGVPHSAPDHGLPFATPAPSGSRTKVHCPNCDRPLALTAEVAGQIVSCPGCRRRMKMPLELPATPTAGNVSASNVPASNVLASNVPATSPSASGPTPSASAPAPASSPYSAGPTSNTGHPYGAAPASNVGNPYGAGGPPLGGMNSAGGNPYQTPIGGTGVVVGGHSEPITYVLPGIFMASVAGLSVLVSGAQVFFGVLGGINGQAPDAILAMLFFGIPLLINLLIVAGGIQMARRQSLTLCRIAAALAIVPLFGFCCVGNMPFGIWSMVVLMMDNANRDFH
ncbi:zinc ribbon domain-containing protein [Roseimaritima ulvae]|uniref:Uncharacterized protein n=1 Tax=Roseimaritima ulvae TaxID=980254 RepID=A0A5B9R0Y7_9BACT|nr:hypothetical protein [Roseimaritima ulvae]QEG39943.1 hypothetical protein UC8_19450 [Roseimaritima ulvae]